MDIVDLGVVVVVVVIILVEIEKKREETSGKSMDFTTNLFEYSLI